MYLQSILTRRQVVYSHPYNEWHWYDQRNHGLLQPPITNIDEIWDQLEKYAVGERLKYSFVGNPSKVKKGLESFLNRTQVDEIMAVSHIYDHIARLRSFEILSSI